jgi:hypothetical protein
VGNKLHGIIKISFGMLMSIDIKSCLYGAIWKVTTGKLLTTQAKREKN